MKYFLALLLAGCSTHEDIRVVGSGGGGVLIYDPNNDTLYAFEPENAGLKKWPHWNKHGR